MAYHELKIKDQLSTNDRKKFIEDISTRKEYFSLKIDRRKPIDIAGIIKNEHIKKLKSDIIPKFMLEKEFIQGNFLRLHSYQLFVKNYINPNTTFSRLLMKWETGTGKTIGAISMAMNFINYYKKEYEKGSLQIGSVFIIGFSGSIFKRELLRFPELGFISRSELKRFNHLKKLAVRGTKTDLDKLQEFTIRVKKRFTSRKNNGFFRFYGYKEFVNRIFLPRERNVNIGNMTETEILTGLKTKKIKFNTELLESFQNSLIICDEIHNVYNSVDKNNWGVAVQSVLDNVDSVRAVFLSATPLNNSPTEIIDLMNLLLPSKNKLKKDDFFSNIKTGEMKKGALDKIKQLSAGRVSFLKDTNPKYFPSKTYMGEKIHGIDYLLFTRSPMSQFHYNTYKQVYTGTLTQDSQYLIDFILPNPEDATSQFDISNKGASKTGLGLYQTKKIKAFLPNASQSWKDKYGFDLEDNIIVGDALEMSKLKQYSAKYFCMINHISDAIRKKMGKIFIYHNVVHMSGVLFIQEVLKKNGIISEFDSAANNTLCSKCGIILKKHKVSKEEHDFIAARFVIVHSEIDRTQVNKSIEKYNHPNNAEGHYIMILVGSRMIRESHDIKAVQNLFIMGRPDNISTLIQIIGRGVRNNSHIDLPPDQRNVRVRIFTTCLPIKDKFGYKKSYEEIKYGEKVESYKIIQKIEKKFHEGAIDIPININKLFDKEGKLKSTDPLGPINFTPDFKIPKNFNTSNIITSTFDVYYKHDEMNYIYASIKRLFIERDPVWTYDQLFDAIKNPPCSWEININTALFDESNFQIALSKLLWTDHRDFTEPILIREDIEKSMDENIYDTIIESMTDSNDKVIILPDGQQSVVVQIHEYYCITPLNMDTFKPIIDIEMPYRRISKTSNRTVNIKSYLENKSPTTEYPQRKVKFKQKYQYLELDAMEDAVCDYGADFHQLLIEDSIEYIFNLLTGRNLEINNEFHEFYFKMIYYYDIIGIIIWADVVKDSLLEKYAQYIDTDVSTQSKKNLKVPKNTDDKKTKDKSDILKILESSINKSGCGWCPLGVQKKYYASLTSSLELSRCKPKSLKKCKISAHVLPVGHFIRDVPRFYDVEFFKKNSISSKNSIWIDIPSYINKLSKNWIENDLIIGYDEKSKTGIHVRFKLRSPIQDIKKYKDTRRIEKGSICSSKSKVYLLHLIKELDIEIPKRVNINSLCNAIRTRLIHNELKERKEKSSVKKWFYGYYEKMPAFT